MPEVLLLKARCDLLAMVLPAELVAVLKELELLELRQEVRGGMVQEFQDGLDLIERE